MPVDPAVRALLDAFAEGDDVDVSRARATLDSFARAVSSSDDAADATDEEVAGVPVRRYHPTGTPYGPPLVWFHGGGYVTGGRDAIDPLCRAVLSRTRAPLVSVDYRLAPENPFPAAFEDCLAVVRALAADGPVAVGGDSAGGGLAAGVCLVLRDEELPLLGQLLVTPMVDLTLSQPSIRSLGSGFGLTRDALEQFVALYLDGTDPRDPRCSPLLAEDLAGLPPAVVVTAECDPLRDEGEAYAARLRDAGVPVAARRYEAMVHGFVGMSSVTPVADQALDWMVDALVRPAAG